MKITVVCAGKIKEKFYRDAITEYSRRLSRYCKLEIIEVADEQAPDHVSEGYMEQIRQKEGKRMLAAIRDDGYVIALAIAGKMYDSEELSRELEQLGVYGISHIYLIIGGSFGLSKEVLARADLQLSFSRMTFPHQLMRVILLEQIYRAYRIMHGEPYHK